MLVGGRAAHLVAPRSRCRASPRGQLGLERAYACWRRYFESDSAGACFGVVPRSWKYDSAGARSWGSAAAKRSWSCRSRRFAADSHDDGGVFGVVDRCVRDPHLLPLEAAEIPSQVAHEYAPVSNMQTLRHGGLIGAAGQTVGAVVDGVGEAIDAVGDAVGDAWDAVASLW